MRGTKFILALLAGSICVSPVLPVRADETMDDCCEEAEAPRLIERTSLSPEWIHAVGEAERWQFAGDLAMICNQPIVAYPFYYRTNKIFPRTRHGKLAAHRGNYVRRELRNPNSMPPEQNWVDEIYDTLTW